MKVTLKNKDVVTLSAALQSLDGVSQVTDKGVTVQPYKFGGTPGVVRYRVARNRHALRDALDAINAQRGSLAQATDHAQALSDWQAFLSADAGEFTLFALPVANLNMEENGLAPSVLEALIPVIEGEL